MKITNSADIYEDSGLKNLIYELELKTFFQNKDYGNNRVEFFFVINCLKHNIKNRIRFSAKDKVLYWDVILDYGTIKNAAAKEKKIILASSIINSFDVLDKYKKLNITKDAIKRDMKKYFIKLGWI
jgi:hypothetical protein